MSNESKILDKVNLGWGYNFIPSPVWYSARVEVPVGTELAVSKLFTKFQIVQAYLDQVYEQTRLGNPAPEMSEEVKEALWPDRVGAKPVKQPNKRGTAAASKPESQNS